MTRLTCIDCGATYEAGAADTPCPVCGPNAAVGLDLPDVPSSGPPRRGPFLAGFAVGGGLAVALTALAWIILLNTAGARPGGAANQGAATSQTQTTSPESEEQPDVRRMTIAELIHAVEQGKGDIRLLAIEELETRGPKARPAVPALLHLVGGKDATLADAAEKTLLAIPLGPQELPILREGLASKNPPRVRLSSLHGLRGMSEAASDAVALLGDSDPAIQSGAVDVLKGLGANARSELPALLTLLGGADAPKRQRAADVLASVRPLSAAEVPALVKALETPSEPVRLYATEALADIGPGAATAAEPLTHLYTDPNAELRRRAVTAVGKIGKAARPTLTPTMALLTDKEEAVADAASTALAGIGPFTTEELPALRKGTWSQNLRLRRFSTASLVPLKGEARVALSDLTRLLKDDDAEVRLSSLRALEAIGPDANGTCPDVIAALDRVEGEPLRQATATLVALGPPRLVDLPLLRRLVKDRRSLVRAASARLLVPLKTEDDASVAAVLVMHDAQPQAREMGLAAVKEVPTETLRRLAGQFKGHGDYFRGGLESGAPDSQAETIRVLGTMGTEGAPALPPVLGLASKSQTPLGKSAIRLLPIIAPTEAQVHRLLVSKLGTPIDEEKVVIDALAAIGKPVARPLANALSSPNSRVRLGAAVALKRIGPPAHDDAITALDERLRGGEPPEVRAAMVEAYRRLKEKE